MTNNIISIVFLQQFWASLEAVNGGGDVSRRNDWITQEGRLRMIGVANETIALFNVTII